mgnify:CR=1 FL=1
MIYPHETFPALAELPVIHAFTGRVPGLDTKTDRGTALARIESHHTALRESLGFGGLRFVTAAQVHCADVAVVDLESAAVIPAVDGLITADPRVWAGLAEAVRQGQP